MWNMNTLLGFRLKDGKSGSHWVTAMLSAKLSVLTERQSNTCTSGVRETCYI